MVARLLLFHCTTEQGKKLLPVTVSVNAGVPAVAFTGETAASTEVGSVPGAETVKLAAEEIAAPLATVTASVPCAAISAAEIDAVSCVALTNVVARSDPFQLTTDVFTKFEPVTVSVKPVMLHDGVEAPEVVDAESDVIDGAKIVNVDAGEDPPPGPRVKTMTCAVPVPTKSVAGTVALS